MQNLNLVNNDRLGFQLLWLNENDRTQLNAGKPFIHYIKEVSLYNVNVYEYGILLWIFYNSED